MIKSVSIPETVKTRKFVHPCLVLSGNTILLTCPNKRENEKHKYMDNDQLEIDAVVIGYVNTVSKLWSLGYYIDRLNLQNCVLYQGSIRICNE